MYGLAFAQSLFLFIYLLICEAAMSFEIVLTCPKGLENLLAVEAATLGLQTPREQVASVQGVCNLQTAYRLCLWSRLASRVLLVLARFPVESVEALYQGVRRVDFSAHLSPTGHFCVDFSGQGAGIENSQFGALKVKDAIVDRFRETTGQRPSIDRQQPDLRIHLHLLRGQATLAIDLAGRSLHQRGWRLQQGAAPLKENLAAAVLLRADWPRIAAAGGALADPMCGVGTLLIEAALMAADCAPGLAREHWGFSAWLSHVPALWQRLLEEAQERRAAGLARPPLWIRGFEADPRLLAPARANIERAGVAHWVKLYQGDLSRFAPRPEQGQSGLVVCNPPYGERLGEAGSLAFLYQSLGERLRESCPGWEAAVLTGNPELGKHMGMRSHKQYRLYNGALPCKLLRFKVEPEYFYRGKPGSAEVIAAPAALRGGAQMFANRLRKNLKSLGGWARREGIECYRLYDRDMPEYALAVDLYRDWVYVQEYAAPASVDTARAETRLAEALSAIEAVLGTGKDQLVLGQRRRQRGNGQYRRKGESGQFVEVTEGAVKLLVNLTDYLDSGLFLDHRPLRLQMAREAKGKRMLNLFCYTATASVHAAKGGARSTTSVDMSKTYLDWAARNFARNGLAGPHHLIQAEVMGWLAEERAEYDLIFIDPPTFSNSRRMSGVFDVQRDHVRLIDLAMTCLSKDGVLYFSNNFRRFVLDEGLSQRYRVENISAQTLHRDFARNPKIHQAWRLMLR